MINVTCDYTVEKEAPKYPYIGVAKTDSGKEILVLFTDETCGVLLKSELSDHVVGEYATDWFEDDFKIIEGSVTISNNQKSDK